MLIPSRPEWAFEVRRARRPGPFGPAAQPPAPLRRPRAIVFDVGMTLIHPAGDQLREAIRLLLPDFWAPADDLVAAMALAAEARHLPLPREMDENTKMASTWASLIGVPPSVGIDAWNSAHSNPGLYSDLDPDAIHVLESLSTMEIPVGALSNAKG